CGDCPEQPTESPSNACGNADDIRSRHKLTQGQDFGELLIVHPSLFFDYNAARPDNRATKPQQRDLEKANKQRCQRNRFAAALRFYRLGHEHRLPLTETLSSGQGACLEGTRLFRLASPRSRFFPLI